MELTGREIEILKLISNGSTDRDIAKTLGISYNTVRTHRQNLRVKLEATNSIGMIKNAIARKLI